jgi:lipid-A-disaccharide synthase
VTARDGPALRVFLAAGESSGDLLGASLMASLRAATGGRVVFAGLGGPRMVGEGLASLFPASEIAVMGVRHILPRLPAIWRRLGETAEAALAFAPDVLVVIDSPEFTQRLAKRIRARAPTVPIVKYVAPQIWAWRPGRGKRMRGYIDHVLALLPFEPAFYAGVGGPPVTYVGHPLVETLPELTPDEAERAVRERTERPTLVVLPGSRVSETARLLGPFGDTVRRLAGSFGPFDLVVPAVPHLAPAIREAAASWAVPVSVVEGDEAKHAAFRRARAALAASGTVTLELGLAGVPTVVAYKVDPWITLIARLLIRLDTVVLTNLVLGEKAVPEFLQTDASPEKLEAALLPLLRGGSERDAQTAAFQRLRGLVSTGGERPSERAARAVLDLLAAKRTEAGVSGAG